MFTQQQHRAYGLLTSRTICSWHSFPSWSLWSCVSNACFFFLKLALWYVCYCLFFFSCCLTLRIQNRVSQELGKHLNTDLHSSPAGFLVRDKTYLMDFEMLSHVAQVGSRWVWTSHPTKSNSQVIGLYYRHASPGPVYESWDRTCVLWMLGKRSTKLATMYSLDPNFHATRKTYITYTIALTLLVCFLFYFETEFCFPSLRLP